MSIVSDFGKKVSKKTKEISGKAKMMSETNALNNVIKGEECRIDFQYKAIGKLYFDKYGDNPAAEFADSVEIIKTSKQKIEDTYDEIRKVKSRFNCPNCGTAFKSDALFCSKCGTKLPERNEEKQEIPDDAKKCDKCGNLLKKDALFCNLCGSKLESTATETAEKTENTADETFKPEQDTVEKNAVSLSKNKTPVTAETASEARETEPAPADEANAEKAVQLSKPDTTVKSDNNTEAKADVTVVDTEADKAVESKEKSSEKICKKCGNKMLADDIFCNECGTKIE